MQIGQEVLRTEGVPLEQHYFWEIFWYHGEVINNAPLLYLQQKMNIVLLHHVLLNSFG